MKFRLKHFFQLIRYKNLLILAGMQFFFFSIFSNGFSHETSVLTAILLLQTTMLLAGAGNVINDFFDVETDRINKPTKVLIGHVINGKSSLYIYYLLNFFGIISGIVLAFYTKKIIYGALFIGISALLFLYSARFKKIALLGNSIVSFFIALSIILVFIFAEKSDSSIFTNNKLLVFVYSLFAFLINLTREILKDIEDIKGDSKMNLKTLPILIGSIRSINIIFNLILIQLILIILFITFINQIYFTSYTLAFIITPLSYFLFFIKKAKSQKQIHQLSTLLKIIMVFGILSVLLLTI